MLYKFVSGFGQFHTNESDPKNPNKTLTEYLSIGWFDVKALVDNPPTADKRLSQWLIPSNHPSRNFKQQEQHGRYSLLWADLDKNPPSIEELAGFIESVLPGCDYEIFNTRSATAENPKARILIPIASPIAFNEWNIFQQILNDKLDSEGITPDRTSERAAQLCYLPNRGRYYSSESRRNNCYFDPLQYWANELNAKRDEIAKQEEALRLAQHNTVAKRTALRVSHYPSLIDAFNATYSPQEWLLKAGYAQRGNSFRHPHSESGSYSASVKQDSTGLWRVNSLSLNDKLYSGGNGAHDSYSSFCTLFHHGDQDSALIDAGDNWLTIGGISYNKAKQREYSENQTGDGKQKDNYSEPKGEGLNLRSMDTIKMKSIKWLWKGWIPKGYITIWAGESGAGKTSILADIVARESAGNPFPGESGQKEAGRILWLGSEDGMADLTKPRLIANNADCSRIFEITPHKNGDNFSLQDDIARAETTLSGAKNNGHPFTMLIIDPVTSYLPGKRIKNISSNDTSNIRAILEPWLRLAEKYNIAIVCITHFAKAADRTMMARVLGSTAFVQTCRSLCVVVSLPDDVEPYVKGLLQIKNNLPQSPKGGWRLKTVQVTVGVDDDTGEPIEATKPEWIELDSHLTEDNFMTKKATARKSMETIFEGMLKKLFSPTPDAKFMESDIKDEAIKAGVSENWWVKNNAQYFKKFKEEETHYCELKEYYKERLFMKAAA